MNLIYVLLSTLFVSLTGLVGIFSLLMKERKIRRIIEFIVPFSAGVLLSNSFLHILPEALENLEKENALLILIIGFLFFLFLEFVFHWHHCHEYKCTIHSFGYLVIIADVIHNFLDGISIGITYSINVYLGIFTTLAIILHEIPQELGNFSLLLASNFKREKAILLTFLSQLSAILGGVIGYVFLTKEFVYILLALVGGGFLYLSTVDILPNINKESKIKKRFLMIIIFIVGIVFMYFLKLIYER
ncbi:MAG: ZIP family metal transporter [Candidatus Aenigmatarchaeota archaeon]